MAWHLVVRIFELEGVVKKLQHLTRTCMPQALSQMNTQAKSKSEISLYYLYFVWYSRKYAQQ